MCNFAVLRKEKWVRYHVKKGKEIVLSILYCYVQIDFDPGFSLVFCHADFDDEPFPLSDILQKERLDAVRSAVSDSILWKWLNWFTHKISDTGFQIRNTWTLCFATWVDRLSLFFLKTNQKTKELYCILGYLQLQKKTFLWMLCCNKPASCSVLKACELVQPLSLKRGELYIYEWNSAAGGLKKMMFP